MREIDLVDMLKAGVHFGHQKSRWHPKMAPYIFTARNSIYIIDLEKTKEKLTRALEYIHNIARQGGTILFIGSKRQAQPIVKQHAMAVNMPYVTERWVGGTFTNYETIQKLIDNFKTLQSKQESGGLSHFTKKERLRIEEKLEKMKKVVGGITSLTKLPEAVFVVDLKQDRTAVREAKKRGIPIIGMADTNVSPEGIDYVIPANDDATKSIELITSLVAEAISEGQANPIVPPVTDKPGIAATTNAKSAAPKANIENKTSCNPKGITI